MKGNDGKPYYGKTSGEDDFSTDEGTIKYLRSYAGILGRPCDPSDCAMRNYIDNIRPPNDGAYSFCLGQTAKDECPYGDMRRQLSDITNITADYMDDTGRLIRDFNNTFDIGYQLGRVFGYVGRLLRR